MQAIFSSDSSFFSIRIGNMLPFDVTNDVISFSLTEEQNRPVNGNLTMFDPTGQYAQLMQNGARFTITWGYKTRYANTAQLEVTAQNPTEMTGDSVRRGLQCMVVTPSGSGDQSGTLTTSASFYGYEYFSDLKDTIVYQSGPRSLAVSTAMGKLGVALPNCMVQFAAGSDALTPGGITVRQNETNYKFLLRLAYEWQCFFSIGQNPAGILYGLFIDRTMIGGPIHAAFNMMTTGGVGGSKLLEYGLGSGRPNVKSYTWQQNVGDGGTGDNVQIQQIGGQYVISRMVAETDHVATYVLNTERLAQFIKENPGQSESFLRKSLAASSMDSEVAITKAGKIKVSNFFDKVDSTTAPQGIGFSINCQMIGDPLLTAPMAMKFGKGFPPQLITPRDNACFYIKKVTHTLDASGYNMSVEITDSYTLNNSFIQ